MATALGLYSFTSINGPNTKPFYFPPITGDEKRIFHLNQSGNGLQPIEHMEGYYLTTGTGPIQPGYGEITCTLDMLPSYLTLKLPDGTIYATNKTVGNYAIENAIQDFFKKVVAGGLGVLVDHYSLSDGTVASRTSKAILSSDVTNTRLIGGTHATIDITLAIPSGKWTMPDGSEMYFH